MRFAFCLAIIALLAACGGEGAASPPGQAISAGFPVGGVANVIAIDATDRLALRQALLIAPDGHATAATSVTANPSPTENFSGEFPAGSYSGNQFGVSSIGSNALSPGVVGAARTQTTLLAIVSSASIPVPDPVAYRRDWQKYRIILRFGTPPEEVETREIPAPAPPPPGSSNS
jgi:hypothetical protein